MRDTSSTIRSEAASARGGRPRRYARSSSFRLALFMIALCTGAVLILGYFAHYFYQGRFIHGTEAIIDTEIRYISAWEREKPLPEILYAVRGAPDRIYLPVQKGKPFSSCFPVPEEVSKLTEGVFVFWDTPKIKKYAAKVHRFPNGEKLLVGVDITAVAANFAFMKWLSILSIVFMMIVIATSYLTSRFVVEGTNRIGATASRIMRTGDLSQRIEITSGRDDLSNMAGALNALLERVQNLMQGIRQVSDNIAHDLRTPLTRLRTDIEEIQNHPAIRGNPELRERFDSLVTEADHLLSTFNALLRISRIEAGASREAFTAIDLAAIADDCAGLYGPLAEEKEVCLTLMANEPVLIDGDQDLVFQALANVLDNAIKYAPRGGKVEIAVQYDEGHAAVSVTDNGPGVPEDQRQRVFERFYRCGECRSLPGTGLGLSLVQAVMSLHGGEITLDDAEPGLRMTLAFPLHG